MKRFVSLLLALLVLQVSAFAVQIKGYDKGWHYVQFGRYPYEENGEERPILWRVLSKEDGKIYCFSEYILDVKKLHEDWKKYPGWLESDCYRWLNEEFIQKAFSPEERKALHQHEEGTVSLIASDEFKSEALGFFSNKDRFSFGTPYAYKQGPAGLYVYRKTKASPIWTRTRSKQKHAQRTTKLDGSIGYAAVSWKDIGVRPVIWILEDTVEILSGEGTKEAPFVFAPKHK